MVRRNSILFLLAVLLLTASVRASAQNLEADQQAYCAYLAEQSKAQSYFLRSPTALAGFTQPETGLPTQFVAGASLSLSNLKKADSRKMLRAKIASFTRLPPACRRHCNMRSLLWKKTLLSIV